MNLEHASNAEILGHVIGQASAGRVLAHFGSLNAIAKASVADLQTLDGIGPTKAIALKSAFLLAQRLARESYLEAPLVDTADKVAGLLREEHRPYDVEHFHVVLLNARRRLIGIEHIAQGKLNCVALEAREVFAAAITKRAAAIALIHNHPSGDPTPSAEDIRTTRELMRVGQLLHIEIVDHVILGKKTDTQPRDYASLRELGALDGPQ